MNTNLTPKRKKYLIISAILSLGPIVWGIHSSHFEDTDNAYTAAHVATLSPKVAGLVTEVLVEENDRVKKDQVIARIDARDYQNALDNLRAQLGAAEASLSLAQKDYKRSVRLYHEEAIPEQNRDKDQSRAQETQKHREALAAQIAQAELNLAFTEVRAPADGTIGKKLIEPGMVVSPGQPLVSFVSSQTPWVVANFKETQLRKMKVGQKVEIEIDSIGGKTFDGEVESFSPGTGATFALIPPDNATGNFTKIVQRLPVRIRLNQDSIKGFEERIVPGLSVEAVVQLNEMHTPSLAGISGISSAQAATR